MKRVLTLLLALMLLVCTLAACNDEKQPDNTNTDPTGETELEGETDEYGQTIYEDGIPDSLDYKNAAVNILVRDHISRYGDWFSDEDATDALSMEIYERNEYVAEQLGVEFNFIKSATGTNGATINQTIINSVTTQLCDIDIVSNYQHFGTNPSLLDCYMNLYNDAFTYLNLEHPYWNQNFISAAKSFDRLYLVVGDMNLAVYKCAFTMYFNEDKCEAYGITADELYDSVLDGTWTVSALMEYVTDTYSQLDESNRFNDFYGLDTVWESHAWDGWVAAFDCDLTQTDDDGMHTLVGDTMLQKLYDASDLLNNFLNSKDVCLRKVNSGETDSPFEKGNALFGLFSIGEASSFKEKMTNDYGLLPMPKYSEQQTTYYGGVQDSHDAVSVINHSKQNYEMISAVLDKLNSTSYSSVRPYFIETLVKFRYLKDSESGQVIDIILAGTRWDFSDIYATSSNEIRNNLWRAPLQKGDAMSTAVSSSREVINALLETLDTWMIEHE